MTPDRGAARMAVVFALGLAATAGAQLPYTEAQATAGEQAYERLCASCHGSSLAGSHLAPALAGERFDQQWRGKTLDVLAFHVQRMPPAGQVEERPSPETSTAILAWLLKANGVAAGDAGLPSDPAALADLELPRPEGMEYDPDAPVEPSHRQRARLEKLSPVTEEMLRQPPPGDWLLWGRTRDGHNWSPLDRIDRANVSRLRPVWSAPLRPGPSMPTPLAHDGVLFLHTFPDTVIAIDGSNGEVLWRHRHDSARGSSQKMGLALHGDKVLVPTSDLHVLALDMRTGEKLWDHAIETAAETQGRGGYQLRSAPLVAGGRLIQGVTASFVPRGGFLVGLDLETGEEVWRFHTIARPGEPGGESWNDVPLEKRSGGSVWHQGTFDPEVGLVYYGVAPTYDTGPLLHPSTREGVSSEALYTNCTVALDPRTGELAWYYQHMANDQWDLDWVFERQIVTLPIDGAPRRVVLNVGKMAIVEALDARTGEYLFSVDLGLQNVITAIDPETGRKTIDPAKLPDPEREIVVCPTAFGARSWPPTSWDPTTRRLYLPLTEWCMAMGQEGLRLLTSGVGLSSAAHPQSADGTLGRLEAVDLETRESAWVHHRAAPLSTSALATAGGLVFVGDLEPSLGAYDADSGELLWRGELADLPSSSVITYLVGDRQYVAVVVGVTNNHIGDLDRTWQEFAASRDLETGDRLESGAAVWAFALDE